MDPKIVQELVECLEAAEPFVSRRADQLLRRIDLALEDAKNALFQEAQG